MTSIAIDRPSLTYNPAMEGPGLEEKSPKMASNLLVMPAELRNKIYEIVLVSEGNVTISAATKHPALLQVCHQIREEATKIYFSQNHFLVSASDSNVAVLDAWLSTTSGEEGSSISAFIISYSFNDHVIASFDTLAEAVSSNDAAKIGAMSEEFSQMVEEEFDVLARIIAELFQKGIRPIRFDFSAAMAQALTVQDACVQEIMSNLHQRMEDNIKDFLAEVTKEGLYACGG